MLEMLESLSFGDIFAICVLAAAAIAASVAVYRFVSPDPPPAASESRESRIYPEAVDTMRQHWNRLAQAERDAREAEIDALPDFPGPIARCPMCESPVGMPKHWPPGSLSIHDSFVFQVRRAGHMVFRCGGCGYSWSTKTASHTNAASDTDFDLGASPDEV